MTRWSWAVALCFVGCDATEEGPCFRDDELRWSDSVPEVDRPSRSIEALLDPLLERICLVVPGVEAAVEVTMEAQLGQLVLASLPTSRSNTAACSYGSPRLLLPVQARSASSGVRVEVSGREAVYRLDRHVLGLLLWLHTSDWSGAVEVIVKDGAIETFALWDVDVEGGMPDCADLQRREPSP